jgi:predicted secreted Zn-dependent protease
MRFIRTAAIIVLAVALNARAEPLVHRQVNLYYIEGNSAVLLTEQIRKMGPEGEDGERRAARTKWHVHWKFRHNLQDKICRMEEIVVTVGLTTMRPRWRGEKNGPSALRERWSRLVAAVDRNESHHADLATRAGREIEAALMNTQPAADCDALAEAANKAASALLAKHRKASDEHDRVTDYGRTYGASLI